MITADFSSISNLIDELIEEQKKIRLSKCCYTCDHVEHTEDGRCYCTQDKIDYPFYCVCGRYGQTTKKETDLELSN